ncbi:MAG TPA: ABC transporter substrate-binding protein, partial [Methanothrix sp.]|nr:ABC transporter substrate-binding protein [Methanothrix sp.]
MKIAIFALVALALAATPASAALGIFGNANMDDTIDQLDTDYVRGIIDGNNERTDLADANRDGAIDEEDIAQIEAIINGEEKVLNILDGNGDPVAVHKPVERIVVEYLDNAELVSILNSKDKVVGVDYAVAKSGAEFPDLAKRKNVGQMNEPDYEAVLSPDPNLLLTFSPMNIETKAEKLPGVDVVFLGLYFPDISDPEN